MRRVLILDNVLNATPPSTMKVWCLGYGTHGSSSHVLEECVTIFPHVQISLGCFVHWWLGGHVGIWSSVAVLAWTVYCLWRSGNTENLAEAKA
eukprot:6116283-Amphidinium_carterae.1